MSNQSDYVLKTVGPMGVFVDIGAHDGISESNTYPLEQSGWRGYCIEPNPIVFEQLVKNRGLQSMCYNVGISNVNAALEFWQIEGYSEMLSGFKDFYDPRHIERIEREVAERNQKINKIEVWTRVLDRSLVEQDIDYISIDVEGAESAIIDGMNLFGSPDSIRAELISVEDNYGNRPGHDKLISLGYVFETKIDADNFYRRQS